MKGLLVNFKVSFFMNVESKAPIPAPARVRLVRAVASPRECSSREVRHLLPMRPTM